MSDNRVEFARLRQIFGWLLEQQAGPSCRMVPGKTMHAQLFTPVKGALDGNPEALATLDRWQSLLPRLGELYAPG